MSQTRNMAVVTIDFQTLGSLLNLPSGQEVVRAEYDIRNDSLRVLVEGKGLPCIPHGCSAMEVRPIFHEVKRIDVAWPQDVSNG